MDCRWIKTIFLILRKMWKTCGMLACGKQLWYDFSMMEFRINVG